MFNDRVKEIVYSSGQTLAVYALISPFDRLKFISITNGECRRLLYPSFQYNGICGCLKSIVKSEGKYGLWRGSLGGASMNGLSDGVAWVTDDLAKRVILPLLPKTVYPYYLTGALGGLASAVVLHPLELHQVHNHAYWTFGYRKLFQHFSATAAHSMISRSLYFGLCATFDPVINLQNLKKYPILLDVSQKLYGSDSLVPSAIATYPQMLISMSVAMPLDNVRKRLQLASVHTLQYRNVFSVVARMYTVEGFGSFFRGYVPATLCCLCPCLLLGFLDSARRAVQRQLLDREASGDA